MNYTCFFSSRNWSSFTDPGGIEGRPPINHSSSHKTELSDYSDGIRIWTDLSSVFANPRVCRRTGRRTDGQTVTDRQLSRD